jgi:hypothetical protein
MVLLLSSDDGVSDQRSVQNIAGSEPTVIINSNKINYRFCNYKDSQSPEIGSTDNFRHTALIEFHIRE